MHSIRKATLVIQCMRWSGYNRNIPVVPFDAAAVVALLRSIGEPLVELTFTCVGDRSTEAFQIDDILESCPHLQHLQLVKMTRSVEQIFTTTYAHTLESLTLEDCEVLSSPYPPSGDVSIAPTVFPQLTSLYVASASTGHLLYDSVLAFARQRSLHRLVVKCGGETQREQDTTYMAQHDGEPIPALPLREKLAFLSVGCSKHALSMEIVELIFEMASTAMRRRVYSLVE